MLLSISDLQIDLVAPPAPPVRVVDGVCLSVDAGRTLALVGESGCGKSLTALSILRLLPPAARVTGGGIRYDGRELLGLSDREMQRTRGARIAMIFQEPMSSLNPVLTVGEQIAEPLRVHRGMSAAAARRRTIELLDRVGIASPETRASAYPHQLSGGMRQRIMIAMALTCEPALLIADEPTTALDVTIQKQILELLRSLQRESGMAMLFITHDLGVVKQIADAVCVMYAGRIVERAPTDALFGNPRHPYTRGLLRCTPRITTTASRDSRLPVIPGEVPDPRTRPGGCAFHPRCELGHDEAICREEVPLLKLLGAGRDCACWKA